MIPFTIFPAIDLRHGRVVRLQQGDPERETQFSTDPPAVGQRWLDAGAQWLHVVNLDGAFAEKGTANWPALTQLAALTGQAQMSGRIQFGGGLRTMADIERALDNGAHRVVLGTAAVENPALLATAIDRFGPGAILAGIDARDGEVRTHGWQAGSGLSTVAFGRRLATLGVKTVVHTDIGRDGIMTGVNATASAELAHKTGLGVIASGGVASLTDIRRCAALHRDGVVGVITGRALYEGRFTLEEALEIVGKNTDEH